MAPSPPLYEPVSNALRAGSDEPRARAEEETEGGVQAEFIFGGAIQIKMKSGSVKHVPKTLRE